MAFIEVDKLSKFYDYYEKEVGLKNSFKNLFKRKKLVREAVKEISYKPPNRETYKTTAEDTVYPYPG